MMSVPKYMWQVAITATVVLLHLDMFSVVTLSLVQIASPIILAALTHAFIVLILFGLTVAFGVYDRTSSTKRYPNRGNVSGDDSL